VVSCSLFGEGSKQVAYTRMNSIYTTYEKVILWIIGKLAETIIRPEPNSVSKRLNLQPFMKVVRGTTGIRSIGIYCDILWKVFNEAELQGGFTRLNVEVPQMAQDTPKKQGKKATRKRSK
jgi:hypothetical protein